MEKKKIEVEINDYSNLSKEELTEKSEEIMGVFMVKMMKFQGLEIGTSKEWQELGELFINIAECIKTIEAKESEEL